VEGRGDVVNLVVGHDGRFTDGFWR
jgi:hypothetical protein